MISFEDAFNYIFGIALIASITVGVSVFLIAISLLFITLRYLGVV